ncbi:MAG: Uma2 family endonuclease [Chlorobiales bacterium]|nr:Uma2 family endonuclease [Chlorobiales bacterium]
MDAQPKTYLSPEAYLELERKADFKSEYFNGETFALSGASEKHVTITINIGAELRQQFKKRPCKVYSSDMRVKVSPTGLYTYPDMVAVCGEPKFEDNVQDTLLNPTVIFEVLSESTERYDRGKKFEHYRQIESLKEYILVAQDRLSVEQFVRQPNGKWLLSEAHRKDETIDLLSVQAKLSLEEIYDKVSF